MAGGESRQQAAGRDVTYPDSARGKSGHESAPIDADIPYCVSIAYLSPTEG